MCFFDKTLYNKAFKLLTEGGRFMGECYDLFLLSIVLINPSAYITQTMFGIDTEQLKEIDNEMRRKYPEIQVMQNLADKIKWKKGLVGNSNYQSNLPEVEQLKFDFYCILARVLKSAGEIAELSDFFDKAYIEAKDKD
jgi:hypothetical protein